MCLPGAYTRADLVHLAPSAGMVGGTSRHVDALTAHNHSSLTQASLRSAEDFPGGSPCPARRPVSRARTVHTRSISPSSIPTTATHAKTTVSTVSAGGCRKGEMSMDVRLIVGGGVEEHPVEALAGLLDRSGDERRRQRPHEGRAAGGGPGGDGDGGHVRRPAAVGQATRVGSRSMTARSAIRPAGFVSRRWVRVQRLGRGDWSV